MNFAITGGSGFIGHHLVSVLAAAGHEVAVLDLHAPAEGAPVARYVPGDVRDARALRRAAEGADVLVHLAAAHHDFGITEATYFSVNEDGTRTVTEVADALGIREVVFTSTVAVYGEVPPPRTEATEPRPATPYGASKLAGERVLAAWAERGDGRRCLVIRPTATFGPGHFANVYALVRQIERGAYVQVGEGANVKSLGYVENLVAAIPHLLAREGRDAFEVFNFIDKPDLTSREIAATIFEALGRRPPRLRIPLGLATTLALPFDAIIRVTGRNLPVSSFRVRKLFDFETRYEADALRDTGFVAPVPLREGLHRMVRWYLDEGRHVRFEARLPPPSPAPATPGAA